MSREDAPPNITHPVHHPNFSILPPFTPGLKQETYKGCATAMLHFCCLHCLLLPSTYSTLADVITEIYSSRLPVKLPARHKNPKPNLEDHFHANGSSKFISRPDLSVILFPHSTVCRTPATQMSTSTWASATMASSITYHALACYGPRTETVILTLYPSLPTEMLTSLQSSTQIVPPPPSLSPSSYSASFS